MARKIPRRDRCYFVGKRASLLDGRAAMFAWYRMAAMVEGLGEKDLPKFNDLLSAIRNATICGKAKARAGAPAVTREGACAPQGELCNW